MARDRDHDADVRYAGLAWLVIGFGFYVFYRRRIVKAPLAETVRAPVEFGPAAVLEFRSILVPIAPGYASDEAMDFACRLAAERRASIVAFTAIEVPLDLPLDAELPDDVREANAQLDEARAIGDSYGVTVIGRIARTRKIGRAIVDEAIRRDAEIIVMAGPRRDAAAARAAPDLRRRRRLRAPPRTVPGHGRDPARASSVRVRRRAILVLGVLAIVLGIALLVETAALGGGVVGFALGLLFIGLGAGRLYLLRQR